MDRHPTDQTAALAALLREHGWEPDSNVCAKCGHHGSEHDLGNWCLTCPRPETNVVREPFRARIDAGWDYFSSFTGTELWAVAAARLIAAGVFVLTPEVLAAVLRRLYQADVDQYGDIKPPSANVILAALREAGKEPDRECPDPNSLGHTGTDWEPDRD